jgi:hypothetical protein
MSVFLAMDVPGANPNDPSFFFRLPHLWPMFLIPIVCFYMFLAVWVVRKVREAMAVECHRAGGENPPDGPTNVAEHSEPISTEHKASEPGPGSTPFLLRFLPDIELIS